VVDGFSPCLPADDEDAWFAAMREWIVNPDAFADYAERIRNDFRPRSWSETSRAFFEAVANAALPEGARPAGR
jgi:hypothetical protein